MHRILQRTVPTHLGRTARLARSVLAVGVLAVVLAACGTEDAPDGDAGGIAPGAVLVAPAQGMETLPASERLLATTVRRLIGTSGADAAKLTVDYPQADSLFPPDLVAPTFLWHDESDEARVWAIHGEFEDGARLYAIVPGPLAPRGEIDPEALGPTNEIYEPPPYQASARSWEPSADVWRAVLRHSVEAPATFTFYGLANKEASAALSRGTVRLSTSKDEIGAPIFYRDVPLMPDAGESGVIQPLAKGALPLIRWRVRELDQPASRVVLGNMPTCANCHSFSLDGKTMGMDVDGPHGDKGAYMISSLDEEMVVESEEVITWNSFEEKPEGHKTIGFLSQVSPDGRYVITTLNESLYVRNFTDYKFLQVFYPTGGILAWYDTQTGEMSALPGTEDTRYVHTNGVWSPDGKWIVFSRARAFDPYEGGQELAVYANDPREPQVQYDLWRIPFNDGKGGVAEPIQGASANGSSNTFPKVSPDGRWIVFTRCRNGQLMRPDGRLWIVPFEGGEAREMRCNTALMNSWHSFAPNGRWMVFSSKVNTPFTQLFLTHIDEDGNDSPPLLVPNSTAANRASNIPEFINVAGDHLRSIAMPAVQHYANLQEAEAQVALGDRDAARRLLREALEIDPEMRRAHEKLGRIYFEDGDFAASEKHYRRAAELYPNSGTAWLGLARVALQRRDDAAAHPLLLRAIQASPAAYAGHRDLGLLMARAGRADEALRHLRRSLQLEIEQAGVHHAIAQIQFAQGNALEGVRHLRDVLQLEPADVRTRTQLAWELATNPSPEVRKGSEALNHALRATEETGGQRPEPLDALAAAYAETGRFKEAQKTIAEAIRLARAMNSPALPGLEERAVLYRAGRPYHAR